MSQIKSKLRNDEKRIKQIVADCYKQVLDIGEDGVQNHADQIEQITAHLQTETGLESSVLVNLWNPLK